MAPTHLRDADVKRIEAQAKERQKRAAMRKVLNEYDKNKSGKLERDQVIQLLTDMDSSTPPGTAPTDDQVEFVLKVADKSNDGVIELQELEELMTCWHTYVENKGKFEEYISKYD